MRQRAAHWSLEMKPVILHEQPLCDAYPAPALRMAHPVSGGGLYDNVTTAKSKKTRGCRLFELICGVISKGIVTKLKHGHYTSDLEDSTWIKIKNKNYSQSEGREEFFDRKKPVQSIHQGWDSCSLVCEEAALARAFWQSRLN